MQSKKRPLTAVMTLFCLIVAQAAAVPTGRLALVPWSGALPSSAAGLWPFASYQVFLPVAFGVAWWVALKAGDRFWRLTLGATMAVLLAQAATALVMVWNLTAAGYAAGFVAGKAISAGLIVAAVTFWLGGTRTRSTKWDPRGIPHLDWSSCAFFGGSVVVRGHLRSARTQPTYGRYPALNRPRGGSANLFDGPSSAPYPSAGAASPFASRTP